MGKKLLKTFTNNIGFKILAIAFAFILWLVVYNLNDPVKTKTFTTTVTVTGRDSVVDKGLWPTIVFVFLLTLRCEQLPPVTLRVPVEGSQMDVRLRGIRVTGWQYRCRRVS